MNQTIRSGERGSVLVWQKAQKRDAARLALLVERTVREIYPKYYPADVTEFFCILHSTDRIRAGIESGHVWQLFCDGKLVGTGSTEENHITRVYVLPEEQGRGFGSYIMEKLESSIKGKFDRALLEASAPAEMFYEKLEYRVAKWEIFSIGKTEFSYPVMEKIFASGK